MSPAGKRIFVSYSHKDYEDTSVVRQVFTHLYGLKQSFPDLEIWIDQKMIRVGDQWLPEIDEALAAADLAVLVISPEFLASPFIMEKELERLLKRRNESGLRLVPILLKPCGWPNWLAATEMRPRGDLALSEIHTKDPSAVDRALKQVIEEITEILRGTAPPSPPRRPTHAREAT
jgi:TIR domain-containing protein